ncbi:putative sulfatase [Gillisia sp. Hel_I_86]|uniref:LTA synthase family protein n=1 Tax=Gillisia sp. Hel_I_86 TaxID=1249981 RepID=UPI00119C08A7|nr:sulfatase-like hydrolase/transferase [Gillisia sp. Hel_I_86]TVZ28709.1 putative sulfatase [Gillisia sp. Hel_I_86]
MEEHKNRISLKERLVRATRTFASFSLIWLVLMFVFSIAEITLNAFTNGLPSGFFNLMLWSWYLNLLFWLKWVLIIYILYVPIYMLSPRLARLSFQVLMALFFVIQIILFNYFSAALVMLGADLFGYSIEDIKQTVGSSGGLNATSVMIFILLIGIVLVSTHFFTKKVRPNLYIALGLPILSLLFMSFSGYKVVGKVNLESDFANSLVTNKSDHFYSSAYSYYNPVIFETDIYADNYIGNFFIKLGEGITFNFIDEENFPFLHEEVTNDVLSPFFTPQETAPNIVIILVEGLGRAFTNDGAYLGNFTPFLSDLAEDSMYWKNFLSQGGRTFAVLPSLLGSLPFAENGYLGMGNNMPKQLSLLNSLKFNGYNTSFYYGGDADFDNMALYLNANKIDELHDENTFPSGYKKIPPTNGFTWGYNDKELYRYFLNSRKEIEDKPQLSVLLTVTTHDPFIIDETEKYNVRFEERMDFLKFNESEKDAHRNFTKQYLTILYADDALKTFFTEYKKRADYDNTIFLITGDHRIPEIPMSTKIDRYHVPLIIYSPLLKRTAEIESISAHFNIAPSILAYLKTNHGIKLPKYTSWVGQGLDTTRSFQNIHYVPLMQTKTNLDDFIMGEYHLNGTDLFKLNSELGENLVEDETEKNRLRGAFEQFKQRNSQIIKGKQIIPDSIYSKYTPK